MTIIKTTVESCRYGVREFPGKEFSVIVFVVALMGFFNGYIAVYVFSGHGVNHGNCTSENIITTVIHHHPSVFATITAREVAAEL